MGKSKEDRYHYYSNEVVLELIENSMNGCQSSASKLFKMYQGYLYSLANKYFTGLIHEDIEDEIILFTGRIFSRDLHLYDSEKSKFGTWLGRSFINHLKSISSRKKTVSATSIEEIYPVKPGADGADRFKIEDENSGFERFGEGISFYRMSKMLINAAGPFYARIIMYRHYYGMQANQTEERVGIPRGTYKYYERKAMDKLKSVLNKSDFLN